MSELLPQFGGFAEASEDLPSGITFPSAGAQQKVKTYQAMSRNILSGKLTPLVEKTTQGEIFLGWQESKIRLKGGDWEVFGTGYDKTGAFLNQINNFMAAGVDGIILTLADASAAPGISSNETRGSNSRTSRSFTRGRGDQDSLVTAVLACFGASLTDCACAS